VNSVGNLCDGLMEINPSYYRSEYARLMAGHCCLFAKHIDDAFGGA